VHTGSDNTPSYSVRVKGWTICVGDSRRFHFSHRSPNILSRPFVSWWRNIRFTYIEARGSFAVLDSLVQRPHDGVYFSFNLFSWFSTVIGFFRKGRSRKLMRLFVELRVSTDPLVFYLNSGARLQTLLTIQPSVESRTVAQSDLSWVDSFGSRDELVGYVVQSASRRINYDEIVHLLKQLQATLTREQYKEIEESISKSIAPVKITAHGYSAGLEFMDQSALINDASRIFETLKALGYSSFINSGTLLGYVRDGKLIGHDDDLDLAVMLPGKSEAEISRSWIELINVLSQYFDLTKKVNEIATIKLDFDVEIDIFPAWSLNGRLFVYPYCYGDLPLSALLPIREVYWVGFGLGVPQCAEALLVVNYGEGWRTPDRLWRFDWKGANLKFKSFIGFNRKI
jgi:hypothetical protein